MIKTKGELENEVRTSLLAAQRNEITEHLIYSKLAASAKNSSIRDILNRISEDELRHYGVWREHTGVEVKPDMMKVQWYVIVARIFGVTFGVKLMEKGESGAQVSYGRLSGTIPEAEVIGEDEERHERELIGMIDEERLRYVSSIVLGLNDALVEFTGALAGFAFALQNSRLVAVTGLIMGFAATLSMAASEYLSTKSEGGGKNPLKASAYTGVVYMLTVMILVLPFLLIANVYASLGLTLLSAVLVIAVFTYYVSVAKDQSFKHKFFEMTAISLGVAALTFTLGYVVKATLGISI